MAKQLSKTRSVGEEIYGNTREPRKSKPTWRFETGKAEFMESGAMLNNVRAN
jgi:hypothetical protein